MPRERELHVGNVGSVVYNAVWCGVQLQLANTLVFVGRSDIALYGPPDLTADKRVCQRCVKAMDKAWKESQG